MKEQEIKLQKGPKVIIPKRQPSYVKPTRTIVYPTPDKNTCEQCDCFPKDSPWKRKPKIRECLQSPPTLYELVASLVDNSSLPKALLWTMDEVVTWMEEVVGYPQYKECITDNLIDGMRLIMLEDPSNLPKINIHDFEHIKKIVSHVRSLFSLDFIEFSRSIGLPYRRPSVYITWFKSRTGPNYGIRQTWTKTDILRWMKIIEPEPLHLDHWDLIWYQKPDFPKTLIARVPNTHESEKIPRYVKPKKEISYEYKIPRRFHLRSTEINSYIWMEHRPGSPTRLLLDAQAAVEKEEKKEIQKPEESKLMPKKINTEGLLGTKLILARRLMPKQKFLCSR